MIFSYLCSGLLKSTEKVIFDADYFDSFIDHQRTVAPNGGRGWLSKADPSEFYRKISLKTKLTADVILL